MQTEKLMHRRKDDILVVSDRESIMETGIIKKKKKELINN